STVGHSAIYSPEGRQIDFVDHWEQGTMVADVPLRTGTTPAVAAGPWIAIGLSALGVAGLLAALSSPRRALARTASGRGDPSTAPLPATLVVIPTYDERAALPGTLERLRRAVPAAHVLVVDDASPDGTGEWAQEVSRTDPAVHVLHRPGKQGLGPAYLAGFA